MRNVSTAYKNMLYRNQRKYVTTLKIVLSDGTQLTVTNNNIIDGGVEIDDAIGDDDSFSALGSTIINGCEVVLYNNNEMYSDYVFKNAKVTIKVNLVGADSSDEIQFGVFTVDEATYGEATVTLSLLDNMCQFDRPYKSYNIYNSSTTLRAIVYDACSKCGVLYDSSMSSFPNHDFVVPNAPKDDCTYREVIGWCATLAGCFAKMTSEGKLIFDWFNVDAFDNDTGTDGGVFDSASPYATGDTLDGGSFNPWNDTTNVDGGLFTDRNGIHHITSLSTQNIGVDDVVITGIHITYEKEDDNKNESVTQSVGTDDYVIEIKDNPFVNEDNYNDVLTFLTPILIGLQFRPCNVTHPNDPTIEAGDVGYIWDNKGIQHRILITRVTFSPTALQTVVCGAESPEKNSSTRLSTATKALVKSRRQLNDEKSIREQLEEDFNRAVANSKGLYFDKDTTGGALILYGHDKPLLAESKVVLKISTAGISMTGDYRGTDADTSAANAWYGFDFNGTWLANIISTINLFFDYAHGGTLELGGNGDGNGKIIVYDASGNPIGSWNNGGLTINKGTIQGPNIIVGGNNNANGTIVVKDASGTTVVTINNTGLHVTNGTISGSTITGASISGSEIYNAFKKYVESSLTNFRLYMKNGQLYFVSIHTINGTTTETELGGIRLGTNRWVELFHSATSGAVTGVAISLPSFTAYRSADGNVYGFRVYKSSARSIPVTHLNGALVLTPGTNRGIFWDDRATSGYNYYEWQGKVSRGLVGKATANSNEYDTNVLGSLYINGNAVSSSSSKRYKEDIEDLHSDELDPHKLLQLPVRQGKYKEEYNEYKLQHLDMAGKILPMLIAEEVDEVYPAATIHDNDTGEIESWDERIIIPSMLALIQEQDKEIKDLKSRLEKLERVIMNLQSDGK